jgi:hypothetical protein
MTLDAARTPAPPPRLIMASPSAPDAAELTPWAREQLSQNVVPEDLRDQLVAEVERWARYHRVRPAAR